MAVHIGEKIKARAKELKVGPTELGRVIHTSKQNISGIYKRKSIDTELLTKFSKALDFDFFQYYIPEFRSGTNEEPSSYRKKGKDNLQDEVKRLRRELRELQEKYDLLKKVNTLLEHKYKRRTK